MAIRYTDEEAATIHDFVRRRVRARSDIATAVETALLRISQGFDTALSPDRWHADLLDKVLLAKTGIRPREPYDKSHRLLTELMRFRQRCYLELDYDGSKLRYLLSVQNRSLPLVRSKLAAFRDEISRGLSEC